MQIVSEYVRGHIPASEIIEKYHLSSRQVLFSWMDRFVNEEEWVSLPGNQSEDPMAHKNPEECIKECKEVKLPLKIYEDPSTFKLFTLDLGLLGAMVGTEAKQVLIKNDIFSEYKGGMMEQFILEEMKSHGEENIFYHKTDDGTRLEIDFLIQRDGKSLPIEVKAESNVRANSLSNLLK